MRVKLVCVGDSGVGKSSLILSYVDQKFPCDYVPTVFNQYRKKTVTKTGARTVDLVIWDTAGQDEYTDLRHLIYRDVDIFLVCFAIDDKTSLENVKTKWIPEVDSVSSDVPIILVACKTDLSGQQPSTSITYATGKSMAKKLEKLYHETSSLSACGINDCFMRAMVYALQRIDRMKSKDRMKRVLNESTPTDIPPAGRLPFITRADSSFQCDLIRMLEDVPFPDIMFVIEEHHRIQAHQIVLCASSKFFCKVFHRERLKGFHDQRVSRSEFFRKDDLTSGLISGIMSYQETRINGRVYTTIILDKSITKDVFLCILRFLYTGLTQMLDSPDFPSGIIKAAAIFEIYDLIGTSALLKSHDFKSKMAFSIDGLKLRMKEMFFNRKDIADVILNINGTTVYAHKALLCARSEYFAAMLTGHFAEGDQELTQISLDDRCSDAMMVVMEYIYSDQVVIKEELAMEVVVLADKYCLIRLKNMCELFITEIIHGQITTGFGNLSIDIVDLLYMAKLHNAEQLYQWCIHFMASNFTIFRSRPEKIKLSEDDADDIQRKAWPPAWCLLLLDTKRDTSQKSSNCSVT